MSVAPRRIKIQPLPRADLIRQAYSSGEIAIEKETGTFRVYDGVTKGGKKIATEDYVDGQGFITSTALSWNNITSKPTFSSVATSGNYNDLSNKPTIPTDVNQLYDSLGLLGGGGGGGGTASFPDQTGQAGRVLTTNGSTVSWADVSGQAGTVPPGTVLFSKSTTAPTGYVELTSETPDDSPYTTINGINYSNEQKYANSFMSGSYKKLNWAGVVPGMDAAFTAIDIGSNQILLLTYTGYAIIQGNTQATLVQGLTPLPDGMPFANMSAIEFNNEIWLFGLYASDIWKWAGGTLSKVTLSGTVPTNIMLQVFSPRIGTHAGFIWMFHDTQVYKISTSGVCSVASSIPTLYQDGNGSFIIMHYVGSEWMCYFVGCGTSSKKAVRYDHTTDTWHNTTYGSNATIQDLPTKYRWGYGSDFYSNGYHPCILAGGLTGYGHPATKAIYLDETTGNWVDMHYSPPSALNGNPIGVVGTGGYYKTMPTDWGTNVWPFFSNVANTTLTAQYVKT